MADLFENNLENPESPIVPTNDENRQAISDELESDYLKKVRSKNKKNLLKLDYLEKERIARYIKNLYNKAKTKQKEISDNIDEYDDIYHMVQNPLPGTDGDTPSYRTPLSTVALETIHANIMNVFFTPKDVLRILPTEVGDIPKIKKLDVFGNWSMKNELKLFESCDRLFHSSDKNGECPYMVHWVKEYGTDIKIETIPNPMNPSEPLLDSLGEPLTQEREVEKLLYNGPRLEIFSRKDYIIPETAMADKPKSWEQRIVRMTADQINKFEQEGKFYDETLAQIEIGLGATDTDKIDKSGNTIDLAKDEIEVIEFYGRMRVNVIKQGKDEGDDDYYDELEDEFIAVIEPKSETLCSFKKNKFPMKMRPFGLDVFMPDDEGRLGGTGVIEFLRNIQNSYDALYNQFLFGTIQSNNPFGFIAPTSNMKDAPIKIKAGYLFPTADPNSINIIKLPPPDASLRNMMDEVRSWAQLVFGISDYAAGIESSIDPTAPAKKAELVVAQGNVRMNLIIKRKNQTLKDIFLKWFLLYQANMPKNKFMRIVGESGKEPWKFEAIAVQDFALNSLPDFELTGNILNSNKQLEVNKRLQLYTLLIQNPFFSPQTQQGLQSLHALTKWVLDEIDETGVSSFLPQIRKEIVHTPEEENARMFQGDDMEPVEGEDYIYHLRTHSPILLDPSLPDDVRKRLQTHVQATVELFKKAITMQLSLQQTAMNNMSMGGLNNVQQGGATPALNAPANTIQPSGMGGMEAGAQAGV